MKNKRVRILDYIIAFIIYSFFLVSQITDTNDSMMKPLLVSMMLAAVLSIVTGSVTNFLFRKKKQG